MLKGLHYSFARYAEPTNKGSAFVPSAGLPIPLDGDYVRLHDSGISWRALNPTRGAFDYDLMERVARWARLYNKKLIYTLHNTPTYCTTSPLDAGYGVGSGSVPGDWEHGLRDHLINFLARYQDVIAAVEGWNEPDGLNWDNASIQYQQKILYYTAKAVNPDIHVLGSATPHSTNFAGLCAQVALYCDAFAYHPYDATPTVLSSVMATAATYAKDVWATELNAGTSATDLVNHYNACKAAGFKAWVYHMGEDLIDLRETWKAL